MTYLTDKTSRVGVILAGGNGTRLLPLTKHISKQLLPIFDKPVIYYSLTTLLLFGIREVVIITKPDEKRLFELLLGDGSEFGIQLTYVAQMAPDGVAQAFFLASEEVQSRQTCLILGDNFFYGPGLGRNLLSNVPNSGATVLTVHSQNPGQYGVARYSDNGEIIEIQEKPVTPPSNRVVTGIYFYDESALRRVRTLRPSDRGELEITDLNNHYLRDAALTELKLPRGAAWFDLGTIESLQSASEFVKSVQQTQGILIGSPHEAAKIMGFI